MMEHIALITGSTSGLGLEIAKILDSKKIRLIIVGKSAERLKQAEKILQNQNHFFLCKDLMQDAALDDMLEEIMHKNMVPQTLIHSLGGTLKDDNHPLNIAILRDSMKLNVEIGAKINATFMPMLMAKRQGRIIHIGSDSSLSGQAAPAYVTAKSALNGYIKSASRFYAKYNIMLCGILPGIFEHENSAWTQKKNLQPDYYMKKVEQMPLERFGKVDEIAQTIVDLACSSNMMCSGSLIELTGAYL